MYPYYIMIRTNNETATVEIRGTEAAYESFKFVCLGIGANALIDLVDGLTGEVLDSSNNTWGE